jgi:hypothetical protein
LKYFCLLFFRHPESEIFLSLLLSKTHYESSIFVLLVFVLKKGKSHLQLSHAAPNYPCWWLPSGSSRIPKRIR